jgi:hypothetical protein
VSAGDEPTLTAADDAETSTSAPTSTSELADQEVPLASEAESTTAEPRQNEPMSKEQEQDPEGPVAVREDFIKPERKETRVIKKRQKSTPEKIEESAPFEESDENPAKDSNQGGASAEEGSIDAIPTTEEELSQPQPGISPASTEEQTPSEKDEARTSNDIDEKGAEENTTDEEWSVLSAAEAILATDMEEAEEMAQEQELATAKQEEAKKSLFERAGAFITKTIRDLGPKKAKQGLRSIRGLSILGDNELPRIGVFSFFIAGIHHNLIVKRFGDSAAVCRDTSNNLGDFGRGINRISRILPFR